MKIRKRLSLIAMSLCVISTFSVGAQTTMYTKGANGSKAMTSDSAVLKSSSATLTKKISNLVASNGTRLNSSLESSITTKTGTVTASSLNVRSGPSTSYSCIGSLPKGTVVTIIGTSGDFYKIKYNNTTGYVSSSYVSVNGNSTPSQPTGKIKKVVLDAGHGGKDPGAIGPTGLQEKDVVLKVAKKVQNSLKNAGYTVVMTRDTDKYLTLDERCVIANNSNADFFLSIHNNSFSSQSANGTETFSYLPTGTGADVAKSIQSNLVSRLGLFDRGFKTANYYVIKNTKMPSALVELAFISNPKEESLLRQDAFLNKCADGIVAGISKY